MDDSAHSLELARPMVGDGGGAAAGIEGGARLKIMAWARRQGEEESASGFGVVFGNVEHPDGAEDDGHDAAGAGDEEMKTDVLARDVGERQRRRRRQWLEREDGGEQRVHDDERRWEFLEEVE